MSHSLYRVSQLRHFYGDKKVLDIDRLSIPAGSITGVSGPNGSGKSTLVKLLAFAMKPSFGKIRFNNRVESPLSPRVRSRVTLLTQTPYLLKRTVFDNVAYGLKIRKDTANISVRINRALAAVGLDYEEFHRRQWHELSGGEAQRVAMAARLILRPDALLLDEPVASVDTESARLIRQASLAARKEWGCTLVIVSHDLAWLHECSDTRISMSRGRIYATGEESVFPPPYDTGQDGFPLRHLGNGEIVRLSRRQGETAVIQKQKLKIKLARCPGFDNQIPAEITQMLLEKKNGNLLTALCLKGVSITLSIPADQAFAQSLQPGKTIFLCFNAADIFWR